jgi:hypothetical protein
LTFLGFYDIDYFWEYIHWSLKNIFQVNFHLFFIGHDALVVSCLYSSHKKSLDVNLSHFWCCYLWSLG